MQITLTYTVDGTGFQPKFEQSVYKFEYDIAVRKPLEKTTVPFYWIKEVVLDMTGEKWENVNSKSRKREYVFARHLIQYFCRVYTKLSFREIGVLFGNRDHSTVINAFETINNLIETDKAIKVFVETIDTALQNKLVELNAKQRESALKYL